MPPLFHPNVYPSGRVCLSLIDPAKGWQPTFSVLQILLGIHELLKYPNLEDPANEPAFRLAKDDPAAYRRRVEEIAAKAKP